MEDWNSKMDKRAHQISELVLLANSCVLDTVARSCSSCVCVSHLVGVCV